MLTRQRMSPEQREQLEALLDDLLRRARRRGSPRAAACTPAQVRALIDARPLHRRRAAREAGLVDGCLLSATSSRTALRRAGARGSAGPARPRWSSARAYRALRAPTRGCGAARSRARRASPTWWRAARSRAASGARGIACDALPRDCSTRSRATTRVRGVVLRIDEPGRRRARLGSALARGARSSRREKPVVASLGDVAASGGYYLASRRRRDLRGGRDAHRLDRRGRRQARLSRAVPPHRRRARRRRARRARRACSREARGFTPDERERVRDEHARGLRDASWRASPRGAASPRSAVRARRRAGASGAARARWRSASSTRSAARSRRSREVRRRAGLRRASARAASTLHPRAPALRGRWRGWLAASRQRARRADCACRARSRSTFPGPTAACGLEDAARARLRGAVRAGRAPRRCRSWWSSASAAASSCSSSRAARPSARSSASSSRTSACSSWRGASRSTADREHRGWSRRAAEELVRERCPRRSVAASGSTSRTRGRRSATTAAAWSSPASCAQLARRLVPGGALHVATDHADYAERIDAVLAAEPLLENALAPRRFAREVPGRPRDRLRARVARARAGRCTSSRYRRREPRVRSAERPPKLKDHSLGALRERFAAARASPPYRADQIAGWLYARGVEDPDAMTDLPAELREPLAQRDWRRARSRSSRVERSQRRHASRPCSRARDGARIESVLIPEERPHDAVRLDPGRLPAGAARSAPPARSASRAT